MIYLQQVVIAREEPTDARNHPRRVDLLLLEALDDVQELDVDVLLVRELDLHLQGGKGRERARVNGLQMKVGKEGRKRPREAGGEKWPSLRPWHWVDSFQWDKR